MHSMNSANVFLSGFGALGVEISKNIVLGGVKKFVCHDEGLVEPHDLNFFFERTHVGQNKVR